MSLNIFSPTNLEPGVGVVGEVLDDLVERLPLGGEHVLAAVHHEAVPPVLLPQLPAVSLDIHL